jgi:tripartite-type tricarboxylate transporter receptor subunit TctC
MLLVDDDDNQCREDVMRKLAIAATAVTLAMGLMSMAMAADWKPEKPITIIVPWSAGGSTDQVTRVVAGELEGALGQKVVVVNQSGASGSIGTKNALEAPKDGYTWTAGAAQDLGSYIVLGMLDTKITDWHLFLDVANVSVVGVNPDTPYQDCGQLIAAMKAKPGEISVATAGIASAGHNAMEGIAAATGVEYRHVTYDGGNPAVIATVAGETQVTTQLAVEQAEMIRGKKLRPLCVVGDTPLNLSGHGAIAPITEVVPGYKAAANYFGIWTPKGVPQPVVDTMQKVWAENISKSEALMNYAAQRGALFAPYAGDEALSRVMPAVQAFSWLMHERGKAKISPDTVGIPKP